jgi:hypothetical protein
LQVLFLSFGAALADGIWTPAGNSGTVAPALVFTTGSGSNSMCAADPFLSPGISVGVPPRFPAVCALPGVETDLARFDGA